jgi:HSP20 family molecular chaperone IbpA
MAETKEMEIQKEELPLAEEAERTRDCQCFVPRADIYETDDQLVIVTDVAGANEDSIDITLDKDILTINAYVEPEVFEGYAPAFAEYEVGDYQRSFRISDEIEREGISAAIKDGVLRIYLPKASEALMSKISVKAA